MYITGCVHDMTGAAAGAGLTMQPSKAGPPAHSMTCSSRLLPLPLRPPINVVYVLQHSSGPISGLMLLEPCLKPINTPHPTSWAAESLTF